MLSESNKSGEVKQAAMSESPGPECDQAPESSEGRAEESTTPKAFTARKISLATVTKPPPGAPAGSVGASAPAPAPQGEAEPGGPGGRKRRWGSSTAVTAKKPSISITTDSLKSLIPDVKLAAGPGGQEAVVELHPEEGRLSEDEEEAGERGEVGDQGQDKDLKIRRTVTQVVHAETQENGQKEPKRVDEEEEEEEEREAETERGNKEDKNGSGSSSGGSSLEVAMEVQTPSASREVELKKVTPSDTLVRRSISQQKSGVSVTIDDPVCSARQPSPPRGKITNIVHVCNLVRPFTLGQLKELLNRTGTVVEEAFWIDKIKSHCYVTYSTTEEAVATRAALHGVKWPQSNPKFLSVDFCEQDELDFHRGLLTAERPGEEERGGGGGGGGGGAAPAGPPSLLPERERGPGGGVRDQWAQREREMERRERTRAEREWDRDKVRDFGKPGEDREAVGRRSRSRDRERRRKERGKSKERKTDKKEKAPEEPPAKLLDDLFCKTKAAPCIYWLPLTEQQALQKEAERAERMKEREKRRKELQEEEDRKREEERRERAKGREKEAGAVAGGGGGGSGTSAGAVGAGGGSGSGSGRGADGERDRERERERERDRDRDRERERERERGRDRDGDKRREGYRRPAGQGGARRSRSRSDPPPRDRRR
ncbi:apoptotic chromatin condensation inducer in the nucleus isoform X4 [Anguilla rostrata]|uniref:apoptotic chromatin condensation inducer in the nucleus isoform X4 n=1 Tax=Anguilla rostrata TaxID=7938 RepID=UPI0030CA9183